MITNMHINIKPDVGSLKFWENHPTYENAKRNEDSGLDIPIGVEQTVPAKSKSFTIDLGINTQPEMGYMLVPRSSISKTPLRLVNSIGIIDKSYRGKVMAKVDNISNSDFVLEKGKSYFQIIAFNGLLPRYTIVSDIDTTGRGLGGFGSTH